MQIFPFPPNNVEAVVENVTCHIYRNYAFQTTHQVPVNKLDIVLLDKQANSMFVIESSALAETNFDEKRREKQTKYLNLMGELHRLYLEYNVRLVVMTIGILEGMKDIILGELRKILAFQSVPN